MSASPIRDEETQCGGPQEACCVPGCPECGMLNQPNRTPAELTALVREMRDWIKATIHLSGYSRELVAMQKTIAKSEGI